MDNGTKPEIAAAWLKVDEAAKLTSMSRSAIYLLMDSGRLAYTKIGKCRRIAVADLAAMMDAGKVPARTA